MDCLSVYTKVTNMREPALDWPSANELWIDMTAGFGLIPNPDEDRPSISPSPSDGEASSGLPSVLVVEDNDGDVFLIQEALHRAELPLALHVVNDGEEAVRFFEQVDEDIAMPCPALVILDINLPKKQGGEVLKEMRQSRRCANAAVIAVSTSDSVLDREQMYNLGAVSYFKKPSGYEEFMRLGEIVRTLLKTHLAQ